MVTKVTKNVINQVATANIENDAIVTAKVAALAIGTTDLADVSVTDAKLANDSVITVKILNNNVTTAKLADGAVTTLKIADGSITTEKIGVSEITGDLIAAGEVNTVHIAQEAIVSSLFAASSVTSVALAPDSVVNEKILNNTISLGKLATGTAGSVMIRASNGNMSELVIGPEGSVLTASGGAPAWSSPYVPTGVVVDFFGQSTPVGWVLCIGRTIGKETTEATELASDSCRALFVHLWNNFSDTICPIFASDSVTVAARGANAIEDWDAGKVITLPDFRGRTSVGADLENDSRGASGIITTATLASLTFPYTVGGKGGSERITLIADQLPQHHHYMFVNTEGTVADYLNVTAVRNIIGARNPENSVHLYWRRLDVATNNATQFNDWGGNLIMSSYTTPSFGRTSPVGGASGGNGSAAPHNNAQPYMLVNKMMKL